MDYTRLSSKDVTNHVCTTLNMENDKTWIRFRGGWSNMPKLYKIVCQHSKCAEFMKKCGLGMLLEINVLKDDQQLSHEIVERFWKSTNTFPFPTFEIGLTPNDFSWLTRIEVGKGVKLNYLDWNANDENKEDCVEYVENLLPNLAEFAYNKAQEKKAKDKKKALATNKGKVKVTEKGSDSEEEDIDEILEPSDSEKEIGENGEKIVYGLDVYSYLKKKSGGIKCVDLCDWLKTFKGVKEVEMEPYWEEITRVFLLWLIGQVLMPNSVSTTKVGWLCNFEDLSEIKKFDWGTPTLACLYKSLGEVSSRKWKTFNGMWMILEYWFYYYFHTLNPKIDGNAPVWEDVWPKIKVFNKDKVSAVQRDMGRHSITIARKQLELRSLQGTTWQPWLGS
ncbi:hypothetical protein MKW98_010588 [Papaver atlanticum]|uniref:Aminotransferase-like plant mobile domain-containing protein n=1 Tax=Papaver atlanticum TaxID=357466 RepID=A0AAD4S321_9MAGN|nr:hypothetical protein MKW98_010588 [Papaver atlanticum]